MYAATQPDGIVYKVSPQGAVQALYDADQGVHCLLLDKKGNIYVGTAGDVNGDGYADVIVGP